MAGGKERGLKMEKEHGGRKLWMWGVKQKSGEDGYMDLTKKWAQNRRCGSVEGKREKTPMHWQRKKRGRALN